MDLIKGRPDEPNLGDALYIEGLKFKNPIPMMEAKIEPCEDGISKTKVVNMVDIAKALNRPASYPTSYFGCEFRVSSKFDEQTGVALLTGAHDNDKLAGLLKSFIENFVMCHACRNLETDVIVSDMIQLKCPSCGSASNVDMKHKFSTFMLMHPPELNIDAFYRYDMPRMETKIVHCGKGIKIIVVNMVDIAKKLARPGSYITEYFGYRFGTLCIFDEKTGFAFVDGAHTNAKLAGLLEHFVYKFVKCYACWKPETEVIISDAQMIQLKCTACGSFSDVDMKDELSTFILENPPVREAEKYKAAMRLLPHQFIFPNAVSSSWT